MTLKYTLITTCPIILQILEKAVEVHSTGYSLLPFLKQLKTGLKSSAHWKNTKVCIKGKKDCFLFSGKI